MVLLLSLVMGACGSSDDTDDAKPTKDKSDTTTPDKEDNKMVTVTFDLNYKEATGTPPVDQTIKKGDKATEPTTVPTRTGFTFVGWYTDAATTKVFAFTKAITADRTLYARWTAIITYTVTFDGNYDGAAAPTTVTIKKDDKATKPAAPTRDGYTFDNWYTDAETTKVFAFDTTLITADRTLYARWTAIITYTVTFDGNYDGAAAPTTVTVAKDDKATKPTDPTRDDYTFDNWYEKQDGRGTAFAFDTTPITANITLYAKWIQIDCREARNALTHVVPLYNEGKTDAPYLPKALRRDFADGSNVAFHTVSPIIPTAPKGEENQLPYISPFSHLPSFETIDTVTFLTGNFEITPDYIDSTVTQSTDDSDYTVHISCYSVKEINENLYFYYGKVKFLYGGRETTAFNKSMYAWTGIDKNDPSNKDALYGYIVSIQGNYLRTLYIYPFVGGTYTRAATGTEGTSDYVPEKTVTFPKTEAEYAALTLEDLKIIATAPLTSDDLFARVPGPPVDGINGLFR